jgi:phage virion morphogenesis protein
VTKDFGERMLFSIEENFRKGGRPVGWIPSKKAKGRTLIDTARLKNSITYRAAPDSLTVGTNVIYARIHQLGGMAGRGRKTKIPARPFLVIQEADLTYLKKSLHDFLTGS